ncbi:hypothetical protein Lser_V15G37736 [Lactuca serriola]
MEASDQVTHKHTHHQPVPTTYNIVVLRVTFYVYDDYDHGYDDDHVVYDDHDHDHDHEFDCGFVHQDHVHACVNEHVYVCVYDIQVEEVKKGKQVGKVMEERGEKEGVAMMEDTHTLDLQGLIGNYRAGEGQKGELAHWKLSEILEIM